jgi:hypothetical protein
MIERTPPPGTSPRGVTPATTARIIHLTLTASTVLMAAIGWALRGRFAAPSAATGALAFAAYALAASGLMAGFSLRRLIPGRGSRQPELDWWRSHLGKAIAIWAIGESIALFGAVVLAVSGQLLPFGAAAAAGLALLAATTPARLAE